MAYVAPWSWSSLDDGMGSSLVVLVAEVGERPPVKEGRVVSPRHDTRNQVVKLQSD